MINNVVHRSDRALFQRYNYNGVYSMRTTTTIINGESVTIPRGFKIPIVVTSINPNVNVFLIGFDEFPNEKCEIFDIKTLDCVEVNNVDPEIGDFLLQENGFYLLQENNFKISL
jgi:hypothetical protein